MLRFAVLSFLLTVTTSHPHLYNPYYSLFRYGANPYFYTNHIVEDPVLTAYIATPGELPTLNVLAEAPYVIKKDFTVVPMLVMAKENMQIIKNGDIMGVSKRKPIMTVKAQNTLLQCTPAVRIILKKPLIVYSLKSSILFPSEIDILHGRYSIPIRVGAVIAPVSHDIFVSAQSPVTLNVVYAIPTTPITIDTVDSQSVVVDGEDPKPPKNVTYIDFPEKLAEPVLEVDEEDAELDYRQPPVVLAPAGIASSSQPHTFSGPFHNSKESPVLSIIREEALKHRFN